MSKNKVNTASSSGNMAEVNKWFIRIAFSFWALFAVLDYFTHQQFYVKAFSEKWHVASFVLLLFAQVGFLYLHKKNAPDKSGITVSRVSGWKILLCLHFFFVVLLYSFGKIMPSYADANMEFAVKGVLNILMPEAGLFLFLAAVFAAGSLSLKVIPLPVKIGGDFLFALVIGFMVWSVVLFGAAWCGVLNFYTVVVVGLVWLAFGYKHVFEFVKLVFLQPFQEVKLSWFSVLLLFVFLISISLNWLAFFRPFPTGFDELQWYLNIPNLMSQSGSLLPGNSAYYWSLLMSVGFVTADSIPMVSWLASIPGIISFLLVFRVARFILNFEWSLTSAVMFYVLPTVVWHSTVDAKVDLTLTMFFLVAVWMLLALNQRTNEKSFFVHRKVETTIYLNTAVWLGFICGFCLGVKYTSFVFIPALFAAYVFLVSRQWMLSAAMLLVMLAVLFASNAYSITGIVLDSTAGVMLTSTLLITVAIALASAAVIKNRAGVLQAGKYLMPFALASVLVFSPWLAKNYNETKTLTLSALLTGNSDNPQLKELILKSQDSSTSEFSGLNNPKLMTQNSPGPSGRERYQRRANSASYEEKERYTGYKKGIVRYVSIFRDVCTQSNVAMFPNDAGLLALVFVPLLLFRQGRNLSSIAINITGLILLLLLSSISILSSTKGELLSADEICKALNESSVVKVSESMMSAYGLLLALFAGAASVLKPLYDFLQTSSFVMDVFFMVGFALFLVLFHFKRLRTENTTVKMLLMATGVSVWLWWMLGNGIVWYGLPAIAGMVIICFWFMEKVHADNFIRNISYGVVGIFMVCSLVLRSASYMPTYNPLARINDVFIRYAVGDMDAKEAFAENNKQFSVALAEINAHPQAKILRIGTFANYFITKNNERVIADNQLESFDRVYEFAGSKTELNNMLKNAGVGYILYDLNTSALDKTEAKSLTAKILNLYQYFSENPGLQQVATDRVVASNSGDMQVMYDGKPVRAKYSVFGNTVVQKGTIVLFKVL